MTITPEYIVHHNQKYTIHKVGVVIPATKGRIIRYRPMLSDWILDFEVQVWDDRITEEVLKMALDEAGRTVGVGDWRPKFGRFIIEEFKKV